MSKLPPFQLFLLVLFGDVGVHHAIAGRWVHAVAVAAFWAIGCGVDAVLRTRLRFGPTGLLVVRMGLCFSLLAYWWRTGGRVQSLPVTVVLLSIPAAVLLSGEVRRRVRGLVGPALLFASLLIALVAVDTVLAVRARAVDRPARTQAPMPRYWSSHPVVGYHAPAGEYHARVMRDDAVVYDVTYRFDDSLRRLSAHPDPTAERSGHVILAGCSFTMGEGVEDTEHLGSQIASRAERHRVYNYGFSGYGPQQLLALVESGTLVRDVAEPGGVLIYGLLLPEHNDRVLGTYATLRWGTEGPRYELTSTGLKSEGSFAETTSFRVHLFDVLRATRSLDFLASRIDGLLSVRRSTDLIEAVLLSAAQGYLDQFPGGRVVFLNWPTRQVIPPSQERLIDALIEAGHTVLDLRNLLGEVLNAEATIPGDGHPRPWVYSRVAEAIVALLDADRSVDELEASTEGLPGMERR